MIVIELEGTITAVTQAKLTAPPVDGSKAHGRCISHTTAQRLGREGKAATLMVYGVEIAVRQSVPVGKVATAWSFERNGMGKVVAIPTLEDIGPDPLDEIRARLDALEA